MDHPDEAAFEWADLQAECERIQSEYLEKQARLMMRLADVARGRAIKGPSRRELAEVERMKALCEEMQLLIAQFAKEHPGIIAEFV
jgi:hypothetical protein